MTRTLATLGLCTAALLAGCNQRPADFDPCMGTSDNLLADPGFATLAAGVPRTERQWGLSEHGAGRSFRYNATDGVLSIRKTGREPWGIVTQSQDAEALAGKTVIYGAEVKLDVTPPEPTHGFKHGAGLSFTARADNQPVVRATLAHEPVMGQHDWQPVYLRIQLPRKIDQLRVGFIHQAGGSIEVRNPYLKLIEDDDAFCRLTPLED